jgi:hypothetical protein
MRTLAIGVSASGHRQLKLKCVMDGGAKAYYILKALARDGFEINKEDLRLDRRRRKKFR